MKPKIDNTTFLAGVAFYALATAITIGLSGLMNWVLGFPWSPREFWSAMGIVCLTLFGPRIEALWRAWK